MEPGTMGSVWVAVSEVPSGGAIEPEGTLGVRRVPIRVMPLVGWLRLELAMAGGGRRQGLVPSPALPCVNSALTQAPVYTAWSRGSLSLFQALGPGSMATSPCGVFSLLGSLVCQLEELQAASHQVL